MSKEIIVLSVAIILFVYLIIKSIYFYFKHKINPLAFLKAPLKERLLWLSFYIVLALYLIVTSLFSSNKLSLWFDNLTLDIIGYIILAVGIIILIVSHKQMGKSWRMGTNNNIKDLVISGLYKRSRNLVYLGLITLSFSMLVLIQNIFTLILLVLMILILNSIVKTEEKFLEKQFGEIYTEYKKKVRRFI